MTSRRLFSLLLFLLPVFYLAIILAVSLHEIAGHGMATLIAGGRFKGFGIAPDGMGWADVDVGMLPVSGKIFMLLSGALSTTIAFAVFSALGAVFRRPAVQAAFLFCAFVCLMDGVPYFFWDAIYLSGVGDFSMIWLLHPDPVLRISVIALCGSIMAAGIVFFNVRVYGISHAFIGDGKPVSLRGRIALSILLFLMQAAGWLLFNWNELVPGVGLLPGVSALSVTLAVLFFLARKTREPESGPAWRLKIPTIAAWSACAVVALCAGLVLQNGVRF